VVVAGSGSRRSSTARPPPVADVVSASSSVQALEHHARVKHYGGRYQNQQDKGHHAPRGGRWNQWGRAQGVNHFIRRRTVMEGKAGLRVEG